MAVYTISILGTGSLAVPGPAALYTAPPLTHAIISKIVLVNVGGAATRLVNLYVFDFGGANRRIIPLDMDLEEDYSFVFGGALTLGPADEIRGSQDAGADVDYTIYGVEIV